MNENRRLLILSCSKRKLPVEEPLPAIQRYDGPCFRVLRRYLVDGHSNTFSPSILILSAQYGLVQSHTLIRNYERRMTHQRASELSCQIRRELLEHVQTNAPYDEILVCMSKEYYQVLGNLTEVFSKNAKLVTANGSMAILQSVLYDWLHRTPPPPISFDASRKNRFDALMATVTKEQVLERAREAMATGRDAHAISYRSWYVDVDGQRVGPKWLVSLATGLPVSSFVTDDARKMLKHFGIEVMRA